MKRLFIVLIASFLSITALAQGKVSFQNDSLRLVYWGPTTGPFFGQAVNSDNLVPGIPGVVADLYLGTSSSQLSLVSSTTFRPLASGPGKWNIDNVICPFPGASSVFAEIAVHSTEKASPSLFDPAVFDTFLAHGTSVEFTFTLGAGITYPVLWGSASTWPPGTFNMDQYGIGSRGAIEVNIPEPSTFALAGIGAVILIFRRRK